MFEFEILKNYSFNCLGYEIRFIAKLNKKPVHNRWYFLATNHIYNNKYLWKAFNDGMTAFKKDLNTYYKIGDL